MMECRRYGSLANKRALSELKRMERPIGTEPTPNLGKVRLNTPKTLDWRHLVFFQQSLNWKIMETGRIAIRSASATHSGKKVRSRLARFALGDDSRTLPASPFAANPSPDFPPMFESYAVIGQSIPIRAVRIPVPPFPYNS